MKEPKTCKVGLYDTGVMHLSSVQCATLTETLASPRASFQGTTSAQLSQHEQAAAAAVRSPAAGSSHCPTACRGRHVSVACAT